MAPLKTRLKRLVKTPAQYALYEDIHLKVQNLGPKQSHLNAMKEVSNLFDEGHLIKQTSSSLMSASGPPRILIPQFLHTLKMLQSLSPQKNS